MTHRPLGGFRLLHPVQVDCVACSTPWVMRHGPGIPPWLISHGRFTIGLHDAFTDGFDEMHEIDRLLNWAHELPDAVT